MLNIKSRLIKYINAYGVKTGEEFTLVSGQKSSVYLDLKKVLLRQAPANLATTLLLQKMFSHFENVDLVAGVVLGGCPLATLVSANASCDLDAIYIRQEIKNHGTKSLIESPYDVSGHSVVMLEDVITTGGSVLKAAKLLQQAGAEVIGVLAIVDRRPIKDKLLNDEFPVYALIDFEELEINRG